MFRFTVIIFSLFLFSCTAVKVGHRGQQILVQPEKPFCDTKKVDPNCKVSKKVI